MPIPSIGAVSEPFASDSQTRVLAQAPTQTRGKVEIKSSDGSILRWRCLGALSPRHSVDAYGACRLHLYVLGEGGGGGSCAGPWRVWIKKARLCILKKWRQVVFFLLQLPPLSSCPVPFEKRGILSFFRSRRNPAKVIFALCV